MQPDERDKNPDNKQKNDKSGGWQNLPATPQRLSTLFRDNQLPESAWKPAQKFAGMIPTGNEWLRFSDILFAGMGTIFLLAGIVFFFAFNWDDLTKWHRFAIVEVAVIASTILAFILNLDKWAGRLALGASAILMGVALVVVSQEYQTGADSYRLFQIWLMLTIGWVLISRWNIMYLMWMILLNVTISLYWEQVIYTDWQTLNFILLGANAGFLFLWEGIARASRFKFMVEGRWFLYIVMLIAMTHATVLMSDFILDTRLMDASSVMQAVAYLAMLALTLIFYLLLRRDLLMVTFAAFSVLVIGIIWSGDILWDIIVDTGGNDAGEWIFYFFIMAIITIALTAILAWGLRSLNKIWEVSDD